MFKKIKELFESIKQILGKIDWLNGKFDHMLHDVEYNVSQVNEFATQVVELQKQNGESTENNIKTIEDLCTAVSQLSTILIEINGRFAKQEAMESPEPSYKEVFEKLDELQKQDDLQGLGKYIDKAVAVFDEKAGFDELIATGTVQSCAIITTKYYSREDNEVKTNVKENLIIEGQDGKSKVVTMTDTMKLFACAI
jgi:hypothetical protein